MEREVKSSRITVRLNEIQIKYLENIVKDKELRSLPSGLQYLINVSIILNLK
ncbi:hypothetical protein [Yersinia pseudotuberculosis]|uniref:hypothetical protein n=1 Tax=Yersinia pseudotuberculosis TaxID=633 RepID=UPI0005AD33D0|nr:hypothetical protein [Yersinia pseudotuberculosis]AJJ08257.1 hypothetical protein BZ20_1389 [Yersinia pseudotuberculosis]CND14905.1 Uncharacterised protein [Yersinia pseudotuberculosis]CND96262.1 Uncharacterised protein [Yersinia pseudotuberculosis]CNH90420.1 Uncharacterised protein [Yersinia pseudotuberculosis]CNI40935.1 Uncharacterised protein [Yersinia pseudotuberculosis]